MKPRRSVALIKLIALVALGASQLFSSSAIAGTGANPEKVTPFVIGEKLNIESKVLKETRTYIIHTPPTYQAGKDAYPVLVVQDAEPQFALTTAAVDLLAESGRIPPMLTVGIVATDRTRDLTPSIPTKGFGGATWRGPAGGADKFFSFIANELLPTIDHNYRTRPYRVLVGHSLGGLFVIYSLMNHPEVFKGYIALSPSLWWDDQALIKSSQSFFGSHRDLGADLYMAMSNEGQEMLGGAWKLSAVLEESKMTNLRWQFKRFPEQDHGTIAYLGTYDGLEAIFQGYRIADPLALFEQGGLSAIDRHYVQVSERMGYKIEAPMGMYADMIWQLAGRGRFIDAEEIGHKMLERNPNNTNTLSMLAEVAGMQKNNAQAIEYLSRVLKLDPQNTHARAALDNYNIGVDKTVTR